MSKNTNRAIEILEVPAYVKDALKTVDLAVNFAITMEKDSKDTLIVAHDYLCKVASLTEDPVTQATMEAISDQIYANIAKRHGVDGSE